MKSYITIIFYIIIIILSIIVGLQYRQGYNDIKIAVSIVLIAYIIKLYEDRS